MVILLRSNSIISDSRARKYIDFYREKGIDYAVFGWDRANEKKCLEKVYLYCKYSGYDLGGFKAAWYRIGWIFAVIRFLVKSKDSVQVIHACDLDSAFPASIFKFCIKRKTRVIFDIFDWFSDTLYNQPIIIKFAFKFMEKFSIKMSDEVIICEPERINQIPYRLKKKELILPNIPSFSSYSFLHYNADYHFNNSMLTLTYVGSFTSNRCLDELLLLVERKQVNLLIAGFGSKELIAKCEELSKKCSNIKYFGKVSYIVGLNIMYNADIIYAMYAKANPNHIFAAPNKYYETMLLGKSIISTKGIMLEQRILENNIGYVVDEDYYSIEYLIKNINKEELDKHYLNSSRLWKSLYKNYTADFLESTYQKIIS